MVIHHEPDAAVAQQLQEICKLYERGQYVAAWRLGGAWGDLDAWPGVAGQLMAARLAGQLGASRRSAWMFRCAHRRWPSDAEARYYYGFGLAARRGPYSTRRWMADVGELPADVSVDVRSSWLALRGQLAASLRDFDEADALLDQARAVAGDSPWVLTCLAVVRETEDRYDDALAAAEEALAVHPLFRPAVQSAAHLMTLQGRDDDALELLTKAAESLESAAVAAQLFALRLELRDYEQAGRALDRVEELSPLASKAHRQWLAAQRSEVAYYLGDVDAAVRHAQESDSEFHKTVAERLRDPQRAGGRHVLLPVEFVRQHHVTCVPATLSAISRYWSRPADHLQVADEICYNGTHCYSERKWARENGWAVREFSVTESSAAALIDRGVPFTFTTVEPADSHLQAIIGYDAR
ncbi:MAG: C39 family peptidase, partial [Planctomycetales bacterium]|nr:C39 family peptidase [Planctomycetales bacterium]